MRAMWSSVALAVLAVGCRDEPLPAVKPPGPETVSLEQVISEPARFDGVLITVSGIARIEFEGNALYSSQVGFDRRDNAHALWLDLGWPVSKDILALSGEEIVADARVDATNHGHMGAYAASLTDIQNITRFLK